MSLIKIPIMLGIARYDPPPPDEVEDPADLPEGSFRFANHLKGWIEVDDAGQITDAGHEGGGLISHTVADLKLASVAIPPIAYPDIRPEPEIGAGWARFIQTTGGRTGAPMPRRVNRPPYVQVSSPTVWTTLALTIRVDGSVEFEVVGASPFPRHWFYDGEGTLVKKSGVTDYSGWAGEMSQQNSPWGEKEHELRVADAESALERRLSTQIMGGARPEVRRLGEGANLTEQGQPGDELFLVLDGILSVLVDGEPVAEAGPGTILGERAVLEGGSRTSTLTALTPVRVAVARADQIDAAALSELAEGHRREDA
jgi:hypothetical protein